MCKLISDFCRRFEYPKEAEDELLSAYHIIFKRSEAASLFLENADLFWNNGFAEDGEETERLDKIASLTGLHRYQVYLLFFVMQSPEMERHYEVAGISSRICYDSLLDLKWKMLKTHRIWGIWGIFCGDWLGGFFLMKRFALGRLEFELTESEFNYSDGANFVKIGSPMIAVHIPASGPLERDSVMDSYRQAEVFYRKYFPNGPIPFCCETWMLYPKVKPLLPCGNIRRFTDDFAVVHSFIDSEQDDRWRVFHVPNETPITDYPEDTSLQRSLKGWLLKGNRMGIGVGYFFFKDGNFVK